MRVNWGLGRMIILFSIKAVRKFQVLRLLTCDTLTMWYVFLPYWIRPPVYEVILRNLWLEAEPNQGLSRPSAQDNRAGSTVGRSPERCPTVRHGLCFRYKRVVNAVQRNNACFFFFWELYESQIKLRICVLLKAELNTVQWTRWPPVKRHSISTAWHRRRQVGHLPTLRLGNLKSHWVNYNFAFAVLYKKRGA